MGGLRREPVVYWVRRIRVMPLAIGILVGIALGWATGLSHYRNSVKGSTEPLGTVLVAKRLIPKGTSGSSIAAHNLFLVTTIPKRQMAPKAISDPAAMQGRVAAGDIYPRQQLEASDFTTPR
jgi:flagella basal body P-ring formation protein FlgA